MAKQIDEFDDVIDSRDVIARIEELEDEQETHDSQEEEHTLWAREYEDDAAELVKLKALAEECEGYVSDWKHGETLIRDSYFKTYAEELADDLGSIPSDVSWPLTCIDWDQAARELQQDYTGVTFGGVDYWVRS